MEMSLIQMFQDRGCIKVTADYSFTYASGLSGPIYCDNRLIIGDPKLRDETLKSLLQRLKQENVQVDAIMAMATGAIPLGSILADKLKIPLGYVRSKEKAHGTGSLIEGGVAKSKQILVLEDLINQGSSIKKGVEALEKEGFHVVGILSIVSYEFDRVKKYFDNKNIPIWSLIGVQDLLDFFESSGQSDTGATLQKWHTELNADN